MPRLVALATWLERFLRQPLLMDALHWVHQKNVWVWGNNLMTNKNANEFVIEKSRIVYTYVWHFVNVWLRDIFYNIKSNFTIGWYSKIVHVCHITFKQARAYLACQLNMNIRYIIKVGLLKAWYVKFQGLAIPLPARIDIYRKLRDNLQPLFI